MHAIKNLSKVPKSVVLNGDLMIKQLDKSHEAPLFALIDQNRSYLKKWLPWWVDACTRQGDALHFITSTKDTLEKGTKLMFGIFYKGEMSGIINFNKIDASSNQLAIGYWIGERFQGLGLVISACSKLIEIGFKTLGLEVIAIRCAVENIRSQKIPIRLGFKKPDVVLKKENVHGTHMDIVVYTIQKDQWLNQK